MMDMLFNTFGVFIGGVILVALGFLLILWILLPFILYQVKGRLDTLISEAKRIRKNTTPPTP